MLGSSVSGLTLKSLLLPAELPEPAEFPFPLPLPAWLLFYIDVSMRVQMTICWRKAYAIALTVAVAVVEKRVTAASSGTSDGACGGGDGANKTVDGAGDAAEDLAPQDIVGAYETSDSTSDRLDSVGGRASVSLSRVNGGANSANNTVKGASDTRDESACALHDTINADEISNSTSDRLDSVGGRASVSLGRDNSSANSANNTVKGASDTRDKSACALHDTINADKTSNSTSDRLNSVSGRASVSLGRVNSSANSANNTVKGVSDTREEGTRALQEASSDGLNRISDAGSGITGLEGASDLAEEREELGLAQLAEVKTVGKTTVEKTLSEGVGGRADGDAVEQTALAVKDAIDDGSGNLDALDGANKTTLGVS